ncbi:MAG: hypothetical protein HKO53_17405 [Gemmatimonadetes bacterium]|nr:hypothetical protein [Gemmatimonadota bacterium]
MVDSVSRARSLLRVALLLVIAILILQALGYGIGFFLDPASGLGEFATPPPEGTDALTVALVGMTGVGMIGAAALLALAAGLVLGGRRAGGYVAITVGGVYILAGMSAFRAGWSGDAYFYAGAGLLLLVLAGAALWAERSVSRAT